MKKIAALLLALTMALSLAACGQKKTQLKILDTEYAIEDYAIAIAKELGVPVKYAGVGEGIDDLRPFNAQEFAQALI